MMEVFRWDIVVELISLVCTGIGVYAAIRSDLALMHERHGVMKERVDKIEEKVEKHNEIFAYCDRRHKEG
jgi:hypothetical protein